MGKRKNSPLGKSCSRDYLHKQKCLKTWDLKNEGKLLKNPNSLPMFHGPFTRGKAPSHVALAPSHGPPAHARMNATTARGNKRQDKTETKIELLDMNVQKEIDIQIWKTNKKTLDKKKERQKV
jgi:hypothetical protein